MFSNTKRISCLSGIFLNCGCGSVGADFSTEMESDSEQEYIFKIRFRLLIPLIYFSTMPSI